MPHPVQTDTVWLPSPWFVPKLLVAQPSSLPMHDCMLCPCSDVGETTRTLSVSQTDQTDGSIISSMFEPLAMCRMETCVVGCLRKTFVCCLAGTGTESHSFTSSRCQTWLPGRELLETIISTYKATRLLSVSQCTCLGGAEAKGSQICLFENSWHRCKEDHGLIDQRTIVCTSQYIACIISVLVVSIPGAQRFECALHLLTLNLSSWSLSARSTKVSS